MPKKKITRRGRPALPVNAVRSVNVIFRLSPREVQALARFRDKTGIIGFSTGNAARQIVVKHLEEQGLMAGTEK